MACPFRLFEANHSKFRSTFTTLNRHHPIVFNLRLQMPISCRFLPKGISFGTAGFLDDLGEAAPFLLSTISSRKSPPENYGKEGQTTVAAFLPWRGS
jgi:hypothetical protein